ncbi:MAG: hypothetical protein C4516_00280 [Oxalobacter sp.]|nr:MAG: hypothetical protein C4516_00280 [Oxalobacter sp.]
MGNSEKDESKAKGGVARANALTPEQRRKIAEKAAVARWGTKLPIATHKGNFNKEFGSNVECYVLNDTAKTAVISQRGMGAALGYTEGGSRFSTFIKGKTISEYIGQELAEKIENPLIFQSLRAGENAPAQSKVYGYDVSILIDICHSIVRAENDGKLKSNQEKLAKQARIILGASAKAGIKGLVYALAGYNPTVEEVISAFKAYVIEEAKKYEKEFPTELYVEWQRLYKITPPQRGKNWKEMHLTVDHIYAPLAKSNGKLLELLRQAKTSSGDRNKKLFQFLNEIGARALRMQLGRVLEMAESSKDKATYETKIAERFGGQLSLDIPTYPIS